MGKCEGASDRRSLTSTGRAAATPSTTAGRTEVAAAWRGRLPPSPITQVLLACETRVALHGLQADSARHYNGRWVQWHVTAWVAL